MPSELDYLKAVCQADPNAYIEYVAGYTQGGLHLELQRTLSNSRSVYAEFPRNHGKTDQTIFRIAWEIGHNPDILIKVVKANDDEAADFVTACRDVLESEMHQHIFPSTQKNPNDWGKMSLKVKRDILSKDPTVQGSGIFGNPGGRADILLFDDICTLKNSIQNPAQRDQVKQAYRETWMPMLKTRQSRVWRICTPWHVDDVTSVWRRLSAVKTLRRPCVGVHASPWPEIWTPDRLAAMREEIGPIAYSRAYELVPLSGEEIVFPAEMIMDAVYRVKDRPKVGEIVIAVDMAFTEKNQPFKSKKSEPDYSVITVAELHDNCIFPFRCWRQQTTFPVFKAKLLDWVRRYRPVRVLSEEVGPLKGINQQLALDLEGLTQLRRLSRKNKDKYSRAVEQQPKVAAGCLRLPVVDDGEMASEFTAMYDELTTFPVSSNDDTVDTAVDLLSEVAPVDYSKPSIVDSGAINVYSHHDIMEQGEAFAEYLDGLREQIEEDAEAMLDY